MRTQSVACRMISSTLSNVCFCPTCRVFSSLSSYLSRMTHHWPADKRVESISSASFYFQINPSRDRYPGKRVVAHKIFHAPLNQKMSTAFVWHNLTERDLDFL